MQPPYFAQNHSYACSLAVLRMVLAAMNIDVPEAELLKHVEKDYGRSFKNLWNPTIAKVARQYGLETTIYALWPLLKPGILRQALMEYAKHPMTMAYKKYENPHDKDELSEPLPLAYKEMFKAVELGCKTTYGGLTETRLRRLLEKGCLVQTSVKVQLLYPKAKSSFHSLLIYKIQGSTVIYHDPSRDAAMECDIHTLLKASNGTGAFLAYRTTD